jgi:hypothetical protein
LFTFHCFYVESKKRQDKARLDKARLDKTRQDKTRQDKTRQDKTSHVSSECCGEQTRTHPSFGWPPDERRYLALQGKLRACPRQRKGMLKRKCMSLKSLRNNTATKRPCLMSCVLTAEFIFFCLVEASLLTILMRLQRHKQRDTQKKTQTLVRQQQ